MHKAINIYDPYPLCMGRNLSFSRSLARSLSNTNRANEADESNARRVAVIGEKLIEELHLKGEPIGQFIA